MRTIGLSLLLLGPLALGAEPASPPKEKPITAEDRQHWAFRPPVRVEPPASQGQGWARNPIDAFVLASLEEVGLRPSPEAGRATLIRRLSFDIMGLPPTPAEVDDFLADRRPDAYERVVDRLLASPRYGERWAQHWLDLARYADTDGYEFDQARPNAWRYRDWVVHALNSDLPYDEFIRLQIAGDEVAPDDPSAFVATGFNRCYPDMVDLNDQGLRRQNALNDITETTALAFLGLTLGCARCHDHKYDPIRQTDFYRLQAVFTPARFRDDYPIADREARLAYEARRRDWETRLARVRSAVIALEAGPRSVSAPTPPGAGDELIAALQKPPAARSPAEIALIYEAQARDGRVSEAEFALRLGPLTSALRVGLRSLAEATRKKAPASLPLASGIDEPGGAVPPTHLLRRGDYANKGPVVEPGVPTVLAAEGSSGLNPEAGSGRSGRRTALADWLVAPGNPLTARVMVNRLWQGHFGRGLVATASDFGRQGAEPTHPELLDWLATEFPRRGWSLKAMHRLIVTGAAYRQGSRAEPASLALDPTNDMLGRQSRRRLDGEAIRDALLAASGTLNLDIGGPCVFPELPAELTKLSNKGATWPVSPRAEDRNRRSLYVFTRRNLRYPFFEVFDRPDTNASCPIRPSSTIAPQALTLLNGKLARDASRALADRVRRAEPREADRIVLAYRLALGRPPDPVEARLAAGFLAGNGAEAVDDFCLAVLNLNEFVTVD